MFLQVRGLTKSFGGLLAVKNLDFDIEEGELVSLIGPNGSGKTTVVNLITGFYRPDRGTVTFQDRQIQGHSANDICKRGITRTFQIPRPLKRMTTLENVMVGHIFGPSGARKMDMAKETAANILRQVGLEKQLDTPSQFLTPSQCRRLEIAKTLATSPKLLILDEVMAGLTAAESENMMNLVRSVKDSGVTILMIEHVIRVVMKLSERIIVLSYGEKICEGTPQDVANDLHVIEAYLGRRAVAK